MINIESLIDEHGQKIYRYCYHMLRNSQEAEDAVQEVFIKAFTSGSERSSIQSASAWLYKVAYNHCINVIRRRKRFFFIPINENLKDEGVCHESNAELNEYSEELADVLSRLSPEDRSVLILRVIEEKSYEELAVIFGKKPDAIRKQYERARKKVKAYLELEKGVSTCENVSIL